MLVMCWRRQFHTSTSLSLHFIIRKCREEYSGYHFIQSSLILFLICYGDFFKGCHPEFFSQLQQERTNTALSQSSLGNLSQGLISCRCHMVLVAMLIGKKSPPIYTPSPYPIPSSQHFKQFFKRTWKKRLAKCWLAGIKAFYASRRASWRTRRCKGVQSS